MVKLQSESVIAVRFSTEEVLNLVTADDDFGLSDSDSSVEVGEGIYGYSRGHRFSSMDIESFQENSSSKT